MQKYQHLFFDLDNTLWDFETNSTEVLTELYLVFEMNQYFNDFDEFISQFKLNNYSLWTNYCDIQTSNPSNKDYILDDAFANKFNLEFQNKLASKTRLIRGAGEVLTYLHSKYQLYIITNGIREIQIKKLENCNLLPYFKKVFISEQIGLKKPEKEFFEYVIKSTNAKKRESLVIGDNIENDIKGAKRFGLDHIYFNPSETKHNEPVMHEISRLHQLTTLL